MKKIFIGIASMLWLCTTLIAQTPPAIQWQKCYGGRMTENAKTVKQTPDGGYIVAGYTNTQNITRDYKGRKDVYVVKTDTGGTIQWQKVLGGAMDEEINALALANDGGYILAGYTTSNDGDVTYNHLGSDCWVIKLNQQGDVEWQKTYGGKGNEEANAIIPTNDGGYMMAGASTSKDGDLTSNRGGKDCWVVKLNNQGNIIWQKSYASRYGQDEIMAIRQTTDGAYVFAAAIGNGGNDVTEVKGGYDYWIVKITDNGLIQWQKTYGGRGSDIPYDIQITRDGGYIVAGSTSSVDGDVANKRGQLTDYWAIKLNANGSLEWQKTFGGSRADAAYAIQVVNDGYLILGESHSADGDITNSKGGGDCWIVKTDKMGSLIWQKALGGSYSDECHAACITTDGALVIAGNTSSNNRDIYSRVGGADILLIKMK
ncbi:MAG: hypothetical protein J7621_12980 [Niastella sp.]|nr:hypothetical protein [Niastella sp.]